MEAWLEGRRLSVENYLIVPSASAD